MHITTPSPVIAFMRTHTHTAFKTCMLALTLLSATGGTAWAQQPAAGGAANPSTGTVGQPPFPTGQGPGYHSPLSPFKPLEEREGVVSWKLLSSVTTKIQKGRLEPQYPASVQALHQTTVKVQGFMLPLEPGLKQGHFLLSSVPTTCSFCIPAGPEGLIEVRAKTPVKYGTEAVTVQGKLQVLIDDPMGLYYRLTEATPTP